MKTTLTLEDVERLEKLKSRYDAFDIGDFERVNASKNLALELFSLLPLILPVIREHVGNPEGLRPPAQASLDQGTDVPPVKTAVEGFTKWWSGYCMDPTYPYSADEKEEHMKEAFVGGLSFAKQSYPDHSALLIEARDALKGLVKHVERNTCSHEETHRGGAIWTICNGCGMKWADDEGGMPKSFPIPVPIQKADTTLSKLQSIKI